MTAVADAEKQAPETVVEKQTPETVVEKQELKVANLSHQVSAAKQKDPKKVAAGRAGAASRKAKQARLEEELKKATERQVGTDNTHYESQQTTPVGHKTETPRSDGYTITWVIGLAAVLGLAYFAAYSRDPVKPPATPPATPPPATPQPAKQLKVTHDPFHME